MSLVLLVFGLGTALGVVALRARDDRRFYAAQDEETVEMYGRALQREREALMEAEEAFRFRNRGPYR